MKRTSAFVLLLSLFALVRSAAATVVLDLDGPELAAVADAIVHARVISVEAIASNEGRVITTAVLEVIEGLKGVDTGRRVRVIYPGGVARHLGMLVSGQIALNENTEVVLYLQKNEGDSYLPAAMSLGYFAITRRDYDGVRIAARDTSGITLVRHAKIRGVTQTVVAEPRALRAPLTTVLDDIRKDLEVARRFPKDYVIGGGQ
ncbi:MAG: hypothetical protein IT381_19975 [Deltaproteobacteria bacterium]|nr:hypothetical protein [Deltaproteobacteria bacterium]